MQSVAARAAHPRGNHVAVSIDAGRFRNGTRQGDWKDPTLRVRRKLITAFCVIQTWGRWEWGQMCVLLGLPLGRPAMMCCGRAV